jgi:hypothetical protein
MSDLILPRPPPLPKLKLRWFNNASGVYLVQVSLLLIGQQDSGHFFRYRPLLPVGWKMYLQIILQQERKMVNTAPTTLSAIQAASQSILSMHNYTPLVISGNDKNKPLTLFSQ